MAQAEKHSEESDRSRVNVDQEDELLLEGYTHSLLGLSGLVLVTLLSAGTSFILFSWRPSLKIRFAKKRCFFDQAQLLIVKDKHGNEYVEKLHVSQNERSFSYKYFYHKKLKYVWNSEYKHFVKLKGLEFERCNVIYSQVEGASSAEAAIKQELYGPNSIEIELLPIWKLILDEITGPFYIYQFFICSIWLIQLYYQFAACILILSILSVATHVWQTRKQTIALKKKVQSASQVNVVRDGETTCKCSTELVPGDVIILPRHTPCFMMECDAVLMTGSAILDESMLTGESVPTPKVPLVENSNSIYSCSVHKSNTLFSGTKVLSVTSRKEEVEVKAVVVRTGFSTAKGELARSILFPASTNNHLKTQLIKMSAIFFAIGIPCMIYTVYALGRFKEFSKEDILIIVLDVATFLIPPALPAMLTSVNVHAQRRLKSKGIYCLNSRMINCSGEVDVMCFDKTGTLTEDSIDFAGLVPSHNHLLTSMTTDIHSLSIDDLLVKSMASCHSLVEYGGNLEGDDLELKLFAASEWTFVKQIETDLKQTFGHVPERIMANKGKGNQYQLVGILKQFPFESFLQRMLVIIKDVKQDKYLAIIKGAPEIIASFCTSTSVPTNFMEVLESYTSKGYRVLATASKVLNCDVQTCLNMNRSEIECNMQFDGLYLFKNKLKESTYDILQELLTANIRCIMVTGDNLLTAINVAQECELVNPGEAIIKVKAFYEKHTSKLVVDFSYFKHPDFVLDHSNNNNINLESGDVLANANFNFNLAIDGDSYSLIRTYDSALLTKIVHKGAIFARMTPDQKLELITLLQAQDHSVGMCGDGANDCGALRASDSGISLSVAEASVASPFTYKYKDISCVPTLLKEGRCTLVAIFGTFKYQVCYCFILLGAVLILFWHGTKPSDGTYVYVDIILNIFPPIIFGTTEPYEKLAPIMPIRNMLSFVPQASMYCFIIFQVTLYLYASISVASQPWYHPVVVSNIHDPPANQLAYTVFTCNMFSYIIAAIIFASGPPYRKGFFSNKKYIAMILLNFGLITLATIISPRFMLDFLQFEFMPFEFRMWLVILSLGNFLLCLVWEKYILDKLVLKKIIPGFKKLFKVKSNKKFNSIEEQILQENWPFMDLSRGNHKSEAINKLYPRSSSEECFLNKK